MTEDDYVHVTAKCSVITAIVVLHATVLPEALTGDKKYQRLLDCCRRDLDKLQEKLFETMPETHPDGDPTLPKV